MIGEDPYKYSIKIDRFRCLKIPLKNPLKNGIKNLF
ncbi:hypothetical protein WP5S18E01_17990 [Enterobacter cloacae]|nr:hypothetical protein WP5S18E01_17990 [Enterobacter cloacae]